MTKLLSRGFLTRKRKSAVVILSAVLLVSFCATSTGFRANAVSSGDDWPMFHHDLAHTGYSTSSVPTTTPVVLWNFTKGLGGSPVVAEGYVYIISQGGLFCINASTGYQIWNQRRSSQSGEGAPAVSGGYVYTSMSAHNTSTGDLVLDYADFFGSTSPTVVEGIIYIGSFASHGLFALHATDGRKIWNFTTGGEVASSPTIAHGRVYFSSWDGNVYALDALTGAKIWNYKASGSLRQASPAVSDGRVYIGSSDNAYCLDALTGAKVWDYPLSGTEYSSPAVANGYVYVGSMGGNIYALNASTGAQIWNATGGSSSSPAVAGGVVYLGDSYKILALNASTGAKIWNYTFPLIDFYIPSSPAIVDGVVYAGNGQAIYAFGVPTATPSPLPLQEPFPTIWVAAAIVSVAVVGVGLMVYFRKRKH